MAEKEQHYQVLARKYRPQKLSELVGQEVLVRTLTEAIAQNRMPHAFMLTGIRGVGKTSTARIIAKSLVCIGKDSKQTAPTAEPCGVCEQCASIAEDRNVDILEVDAASRTGVSDMREIIDNVRYMPASARMKIYIIDEVHMLSKSAFNALLKTLEEPPAHVMFIFATTEIRKVPVTILSRCMRFDLPRVPAEVIVEHLKHILQAEKRKADEEALALVAQAAEGSVRDALSLLDQSLSMCSSKETLSQNHIHSMLGSADRSLLHLLVEALLKSDAANALEHTRALYQAGAAPDQIATDALALLHHLTCVKTLKKGTESGIEVENSLLELGNIPQLARLWQMLLKGLEELPQSPNPMHALEMVMIRIAYAAGMPTPGDLARMLEEGHSNESAVPTPPPSMSTSPNALPTPPTVQQAPLPQTSARTKAPTDFAEIIRLFSKNHEDFLASWLEEVHIGQCDFTKKRLEFTAPQTAPTDFAGKVAEKLQHWTGERWFISIVAEAPGIPIRLQKESSRSAAKEALTQHEAVHQALEHFPGGTIKEVTLVEEALETEPGQTDSQVEHSQSQHSHEGKA